MIRAFTIVPACRRSESTGENTMTLMLWILLIFFGIALGGSMLR